MDAQNQQRGGRQTLLVKDKCHFEREAEFWFPTSEEQSLIDQCEQQALLHKRVVPGG